MTVTAVRPGRGRAHSQQRPGLNKIMTVPVTPAASESKLSRDSLAAGRHCQGIHGNLKAAAACSRYSLALSQLEDHESDSEPRPADTQRDWQLGTSESESKLIITFRLISHAFFFGTCFLKNDHCTTVTICSRTRSGGSASIFSQSIMYAPSHPKECRNNLTKLQHSVRPKAASTALVHFFWFLFLVNLRRNHLFCLFRFCRAGIILSCTTRFSKGGV